MGKELNGLIIPDELNVEFFLKALESGLNSKNISINNLSFSNGSGGGENYCSEIFRVAISYNIDGRHDENISLIVKYMPIKESTKVVEDLKMYQQECKLYFEVVPEMHKLLGYKLVFAPKCFYAVDSPVKTMVFQDLKASSYELGDRTVGLDEEHAILVLNKIAKFHAASIVLAQKQPELVTTFPRSFFHIDLNSNNMDVVFLSNLNFLQTFLSAWPNYESIIKKLKNIEENFKKKGLECVAPRKDGISVLNHGDLWVNNFMFNKNSNGMPIDVMFIDLQLSYYGSLGVDINYFLNNSIKIDVLKSKRYELLRIYYASLKKTLEELNYSPIPSWDQVRQEIRSTEFYGFMSFEAVLPLIALDRESSKENSMETFSDKDKMEDNRRQIFSTERMLETLKYSLDRFDELGVLD